MKVIMVVAAATMLTSSALGAGADIKHSGLAGTISRFGPVVVTGQGNVYAYSLGSNTCNMGDSSLSWINGGSPGLAMNAYRLHNGRFVQIGLGNAKTACCVANGTSPLCSPLSCSPSGFGLRPGCLDTYSASFNSGQGRLAPRSVINPKTGVVSSYPSTGGDAIWRRLQVRQANMEPATFPGALYFVEGHYACQEDAAAGNDLNNASYGRVTVNETNFTLTSAGTFNVGIPAIFAWRDHGLGAGIPDPNVQINTVDIPDSGRFYVAFKHTDNGNGTWHYEYAIANYNSDRAGQSFGIRVPNCVTLTNVGFHDVTYHSDDVAISGTDWTFTHAGDMATWSTQTFAQNPSANALRWGTLYNFYFDANAPPARARARIDLFKPGSPALQTTSVWSPNTCPTDLMPEDSGDGVVDVNDLIVVLSSWGRCTDCYADVAPAGGGDNTVGADDLLAVISTWGRCRQ